VASETEDDDAAMQRSVQGGCEDASSHRRV
jgi:hypothetical protein